MLGQLKRTSELDFLHSGGVNISQVTKSGGAGQNVPSRVVQFNVLGWVPSPVVFASILFSHSESPFVTKKSSTNPVAPLLSKDVGSLTDSVQMKGAADTKDTPLTVPSWRFSNDGAAVMWASGATTIGVGAAQVKFARRKAAVAAVTVNECILADWRTYANLKNQRKGCDNLDNECVISNENCEINIK